MKKSPTKTPPSPTHSYNLRSRSPSPAKSTPAVASASAEPAHPPSPTHSYNLRSRTPSPTGKKVAAASPAKKDSGASAASPAKVAVAENKSGYSLRPRSPAGKVIKVPEAADAEMSSETKKRGRSPSPATSRKSPTRSRSPATPPISPTRRPTPPGSPAPTINSAVPAISIFGNARNSIGGGGLFGGGFSRGFLGGAPAVPKQYAPVIRKTKTDAPAFGVFVNESTCMVANQSGRIYSFDTTSGTPKSDVIDLKSGVKCLVSDFGWLYAGCDDNKVYDLTSGVPRVAYDIEAELASSTPLHKDVVFLLDTSGSMSGYRIKCALQNMTKIFEDDIKDEDTVSLITFDHAVHTQFMQLRKGEHRDRILAAFNSVSAYGGTNYYDAVVYALSQMASWPADREQWLISLTDGESSGSSGPAIEAAKGGRAHAVTIGVGTLRNASELRAICSATVKGTYVRAANNEGMDAAFKQVATIISSKVLWMEISNGLLVVSDGTGHVRVHNIEGEVMWSKKSPGIAAWMVRADATNVYHGHSKGVTAYSLTSGDELWNTVLPGASVFFGSQDAEHVYVATMNETTTTGNVIKLKKSDGAIVHTFQCDSCVLCNATAKHSAHGTVVLAADAQENLYCFKEDGTRLWKLALPSDVGSALSMQHFDSRLYVATSKGYLACVDLNEGEIEKVLAGSAPAIVTQEQEMDLESATMVGVSSTADVVDSATAASLGGAKVQCVREGGRLRVRPMEAPHNTDWNVQFPKNMRQDGQIFLVEKLVKCGTFYRSQGWIKKIV